MTLDRSFALLICSMLLLAAGTLSAGSADWQLWNFESADVKLSPNVTVRVDEGFRWRDDISRIYYQYSDPGILYQPCRWFTSGLVFRLGFIKTDDFWIWERRPYLYLSPRRTWNSWILSDRSRLEWVNKQDADDVWRYRNRLMVARSFRLASMAIQAHVYYEVYWSFTDDEINQHRYNIGLEAGLLSYLKLSLYFMRQTSKIGSMWAENNIVGMGVRGVL